MSTPTPEIPSNLNTTLTNAINQLIQSPAIQNMQWAMTSGCQPSVLNNMYFCSAVSVSGSEAAIPHTDSTTPHADSTGAHVDTNNHVDSPTHDDTSTAHDDTSAPHDDTSLFGAAHVDTNDHVDTNNHVDSTSHDDTSTPHDDTSAHADIPGVHDDIPGVSLLTYSAALTQVTGAGSLVVSDLVIPAQSQALPVPVPTEYPMPFTAALGFGTSLTAYFTTDVDGLKTDNSFSITGTTGTMAGVITLYCTGNPAGLASGFYATITAMTVTLPTSVTSYSAWNGIVSDIIALGLNDANAVGEGDAMLAAVTGLVNGLIASETMSALNSALAGLMIAPCGC